MLGSKKLILDSPEEDIESVLRTHLARIKVIGVGGAGNNTINRLHEVGIHGTELIAVNTDAADLLKIKADKKILIGQKLTQGLGAGADPSVGEKAAEESWEQLKKAVAGADIVFITCGMGGGTGTGATPIVTRVVREAGVLGIGVVTLPFSAEGRTRMNNAKGGLEKMRENIDTLVVLPNDKLMQMIPDAPITTAFRICDEILMNSVKGMAEIITKPGLINVDFADVRAIMKGAGIGLIGIGESDTDKRQSDAVNKAITNPLLAVDINNAQNALINVVGGADLTLHQAHDVVQMVSEKLDPDAKVIWGAHIDEKLENKIRVMLVITGIPNFSIDTLASGKIDFKPQKKKENKEKVEEKKPKAPKKSSFLDLDAIEDDFGLEVVVPLQIG